MHGELVAFGVLIQFILENRSPEQIKATLDFYRKVGLPLRLKDIGIDNNDIPDEKWNIASQIACSPTSTMRNMPINNLDTGTIKAVVLYADKLADAY
jgi:glycerol dehydrogenase